MAGSSAFELPCVKPVQLGDVTQVVDRETGEVIGWRGLNTDIDRCPAVICGNCPKACRCALCRCPECLTRETIARGEAQREYPRRELA